MTTFIKDAEIPLADEFALFKRLCDVLYERRSFDQLQRVTFSAMGSPYFNKKPDLMKVSKTWCYYKYTPYISLAVVGKNSDVDPNYKVKFSTCI